jgi:hypothetical protein
MMRRNGTTYLRFGVLDGPEDFFRAPLRPALFFAADFRRMAEDAAVRAGGEGDRLARDRPAVLGLGGAGRDLGSGDRADRWTSVNRIWSPSALYAQISAAI